MKKHRRMCFARGGDRALVAAVFEAMAQRHISSKPSSRQRPGRGEWLADFCAGRSLPAARDASLSNIQRQRVAVLKQIAPHLAIIHAQNESLANFDASARQELAGCRTLESN